MDVSLEIAEDAAADEVVRSDLDGDVLLALRHRVAARIGQAAGEVLVVDHERVARHPELLCHQLHGIRERISEHFEGDRIERRWRGYSFRDRFHHVRTPP
jgi:hypothetical protein